MYCIFTQLTNSNVLGKSPIHDSNNRETGNCYWWIWQKYNTHVTVKDHIYEYMLTNTDNELYCYSNEFHSHLPFDRPWINPCQYEKILNRSFFKAAVTDMSRPHFHMVDKLGIFCKHINCWFG